MMRLVTNVLVVSIFAAASAAQTTKSSDERLDFGAEGLTFPPAVSINGHTPRTAQLLGEAYRRHEPLVWKRVQLVADLGQVALRETTPYLIEAMKDPSPAVRAEAARSAALVGEPSLLAEVEKLLKDPDLNVRRQAVLSCAQLARAGGQATPAIEAGLADQQPPVIAAAIQSAWTPQHATQIAQKIAQLTANLRIEAAEALSQLNAIDQAAALVPLLNEDLAQRVAAVKALGKIGRPAQSDDVVKRLADAHPTVRREAVAALKKVADPATQHARAIEMLKDSDLTVRQAAAALLTPVPSTEAITALAGQLSEGYAPLHAAVRQALTHPVDAAVRQATIDLAARMLSDPNPARREDGSYVLGRLRSDAAIDRHLALLQWNAGDPNKSDWPVIAQAAESLGLIGDTRAAPLLMALIMPAPAMIATVQPSARNSMSMASSNAMIALGRLRHQPALDEASRILKLDPQGDCPAPLRAAAAFVVGMISAQGKSPASANLFGVYESVYEAKATKFEAIKAMGNLRDSSAADRLKSIAESESSPELRWIAHWSYERTSGTKAPYTPPTERREPPVSISDLAG